DADAAAKMLLHLRKALQKAHSLAPAEPEPEGVAAVRAGSRDERHSEDLHIAALGEKAGHHQNRLPLEERADEDGEVAEFMQEEFWRHSGPKNARFGATLK